MIQFTTTITLTGKFYLEYLQFLREGNNERIGKGEMPQSPEEDTQEGMTETLVDFGTQILGMTDQEAREGVEVKVIGCLVA